MRDRAGRTRARPRTFARGASDRAFRPAETLLVALGAVVPAVALSVAALPAAGIVWLLATAPGVYHAATSGRSVPGQSRARPPVDIAAPRWSG